MNTIVILALFSFILYFFLRERNRMLKNQVDSCGGMEQKYSILLNWLKSDTDAKTTNISRDYLQISCIKKTTATYFSITENFGNVEIEYESRLGIMGNHKLRWNFPNNSNQITIIEKMNADLQELENKIFNPKQEESEMMTLFGFKGPIAPQTISEQIEYEKTKSKN